MKYRKKPVIIDAFKLGTDYLVLLTADMVRELAFSEWTMIRSAEIMAARAAQDKDFEAKGGLACE
jgi:hypothetical protein